MPCQSIVSSGLIYIWASWEWPGAFPDGGACLTLSLGRLRVSCIILHHEQSSGTGSGEPFRGPLMDLDAPLARPLVECPIDVTFLAWRAPQLSLSAQWTMPAAMASTLNPLGLALL